MFYNFSCSFSFVFDFRKKGVTDRPMDGHTLLKRYEDTSKKNLCCFVLFWHNLRFWLNFRKMAFSLGWTYVKTGLGPNISTDKIPQNTWVFTFWRQFNCLVCTVSKFCMLNKRGTNGWTDWWTDRLTDRRMDGHTLISILTLSCLLMVYYTRPLILRHFCT